MEIYSVYDKEFAPFGRVVTGLEEAVAEVVEALRLTPLPEGVGYVPSEPLLQELPAAVEFSEHLFGGMPVQMGWCNGHNTLLNCLEYHRNSEFNLGTEEFLLILGEQNQICDGFFDTAKAKVFRVPAGVLVEVYATSLHYAPCHTDPAKGFRMLVALPEGTNTDRPDSPVKTPEDEYLTACNKWLLAHPDSPEAKAGAKVGLVGENIDVAPLLLF